MPHDPPTSSSHDDSPQPHRKAGDPFHPPSADQWQAHLQRHPLTPVSKWIVWGPIAAMLGALVLSLAIGGPIGLLPLLAVFIGVSIATRMRLKRAGETERQSMRTAEAAMLGRWPQVLRIGWGLIPATAQQPELRMRVVGAMSHALHHLGQVDAAIIGYDAMLDRVHEEDPIAVQIRIARAMAYLSADRLADADDELRRLARRNLRELPNAPGPMPSAGDGSAAFTAAAHRWARLLQQVRTRHFREAVDQSADALQTLQPLGVQAGIPYALLAASCLQQADAPAPQAADEQAGFTSAPPPQENADANTSASASSSEAQPDEDDDAGPAHSDEHDVLLRQARTWWSRATLLLPIDRLTAFDPLLEPLANDARLAEARQSNTPPVSAPHRPEVA